jgi:hypothetical protein
MNDKQARTIAEAIDKAADKIVAAIRQEAGTNPAIPQPKARVYPPTSQETPHGGQEKTD